MRKGSVSPGQHDTTVGSNFHTGCVAEGRGHKADKAGREEP